MSWKRYFRSVSTSNTPTTHMTTMAQDKRADRTGATASISKFSSYLPEVYAGHPNRIQRYYQYDDMDRDSDINAALDTIADFCTQSEEQNKEPFDIYYTGDPNETEINLIKTALNKWTKLNKFRSRLWNIFRHAIKNGDAFFLRDPENGEWLWIDHFMVEMVKVDDTAGKEPSEYIVRGLDYNKQAKFATLTADPSQYRSPIGASNAAGARPQVTPQQAPSVFSLAGANADQRQRNFLASLQDQLCVVNAEHVVHLSLSIGMDINWPFGASILEPIFKTYKQKELLEDSIIIYRVQRAPERRIFYIDTGQMPPARAKAYIDQIKNEIHQRRIPNRTGGGQCIDLNTKIPLLDGRILTLNEIIEEHSKGIQNWVYSANPENGEFVPGKITWAGITRKNTDVIKLTLDNGEEIICTPDHKIPVIGKGKTEAKDIIENEDSLISFNKRLFSINEKENLDDPQYTQIYDHKKKKWIFVHRMVANYFKNIGLNNEMVFEVDNTKKSIIHHKDFNKYNNNPENLVFMNGYDHFKLHSEWKKTKTEEELKQIKDKFRKNIKNFWKKLKSNKNKISENTLINLLKKSSYNDYTDLTKKISLYNHKVVKIEYLKEKMNTGTITVDGNEEFHNYHTFVVNSGIVIFNSMLDAAYNPLGALEDYYFAQTAEGRGSKVETLPGGEMTGEIGDLLFFARKMARGLRIPSSYLALGGDDDKNGVSYNDGKLGAALIQEFRFNKYCMRIQSLMAPVFDKEFKWYLRKNGIEIDENLFELQFNEPQNFTKYRQIEVDAQQVQVYSQLAENKKLSERFKFKKYLNLTDDELLENEKLWAEENADKLKKRTGTTPAEQPQQDLRAVGIRGDGDFGFEGGAPPNNPEGEPWATGTVPPGGVSGTGTPNFGEPQAGGGMGGGNGGNNGMDGGGMGGGM